MWVRFGSDSRYAFLLFQAHGLGLSVCIWLRGLGIYGPFHGFGCIAGSVRKVWLKGWLLLDGRHVNSKVPTFGSHDIVERREVFVLAIGRHTVKCK